MATNSANWRMADRLAKGNLDAELAELEAQGLSYRRICAVLYERHGIEVTGPTVKVWITDLREAAA